jgi:hypothetical protein
MSVANKSFRFSGCLALWLWKQLKAKVNLECSVNINRFFISCRSHSKTEVCEKQLTIAFLMVVFSSLSPTLRIIN